MIKQNKKKPDPPPSKRLFYYIHDNGDRTIDVYLYPDAAYYTAKGKAAHFGNVCLAVKNIPPRNDIEEDIRLRYDAWCESGEMIYLREEK